MRSLRYGLLITVALLAFQSTGYGFQGAAGEEPIKGPGATKGSNKPTKGGSKKPPPLPSQPVTASGPSVVHAAPVMAEMVINTGLDDCLIMLDGETKGRTNSSGVLRVSSLRPGMHIVTVRRNGYRDEQRNVELYGGRSETFAFSLSRVLTVPELLTNAESAYRNARYGEAISASREALASQPDNPRANLLLGEAYYMEGNAESEGFLWKAIGLGEAASLPVKHHHGGAMRFITARFDDLCSGNLILRKGVVEFHSNEKSDENFNLPTDKIIEVKNEAYKNGRLSVKVKVPKGNKDSDKTYNFHAPAATVVRLKISEVSCQDPSCGVAVNTLYSLLQKLKQ
jgi:Tetratricopeptide repeat/PEGA domain